MEKLCIIQCDDRVWNQNTSPSPSPLVEMSHDIECILILLEKFSVLMATCSGTRNNEDAVLECVQALADKNVDVNAFDRLVLRIWTR